MTKKKRRSFFSKNKNTKDSSIGIEINGLVVFALGLLFFLSILTYHQTDPTFGNLTKENSYEKVGNFLGVAGATVAKPVFQATFGYGALVFPFLMMVLGISLLVHYPLKKLVRLTLISLAWGYFISIVLALPETLRSFGHSEAYWPSGVLGGVTTDIVARFLGRFALAFLSGIFCLILLMLTFRFQLSIIPVYLFNLARRLIVATSVKLRIFWQWLKKIQWIPQPSGRTIKHHSEQHKKKFWQFTRKKEKQVETPELLEEPDHDPSAFAEMPFDETAMEEPEEKNPYEIPDLDTTIMNESVNPEPNSHEEKAKNNETNRNDEQDYSEKELQLSEADDSFLFPSQPTDYEIEELPREPEVDYDAQVQQSLATYKYPSRDLLHEDESDNKISREELMANADLLENTLAQFGVKAFVKKVIEGPVITLYAVRPAEGVKINQIVSLSDDLALAMRAKGIRMIAPIPGEAAIGIEIPNRKPSTVWLKSIVQSEKFVDHSGQLVLGMGKTIGGEVFCADLTRMPHLLVAGSTGSGKSVGINTMIASILYRVPPSDVKFVLIDPKKLELSLYAKLKDHYLAYCPDLDEIVVTHPQNAILILRSVVNEMDERYDKLAHLGVRDIVAYNRKLEKYAEAGDSTDDHRRLPYLVVIIDELADLILTASREVEEPITRLAQMARAVGIHLIVATQRPSVDIITGLIKANFPTRIAYQVATRPDSKVILDMYGAEKLIGDGDMLFLPPGTGKPVRLQNPFISTEEVERIIKHIRNQPKFPPYPLKLVRAKTETGANAKKHLEQDDLFDKAREIVVRHQQGSISLLQRKLKVGYARAARLIDELEEAGVVGPGQGSKARDVLISSFSDT